MLSGVRVASYAQALQGLRTETCGCGTLRIGKACRLSLATRSSSAHLCDEPALCDTLLHLWFSHHTHFRSIRDASASLPDRAAAHHQQHGASTGRGKAAHATMTVSKTRLPIQPITVYRMLYRCDYRARCLTTQVSHYHHNPATTNPLLYTSSPFRAVLLRLRSEPSSRPEQ